MFFSVIFQGDHGPERACKKLAKESVQSWDQSLLTDARKKSENSSSYSHISAQARLETAKAIQVPRAYLYNVYSEI